MFYSQEIAAALNDPSLKDQTPKNEEYPGQYQAKENQIVQFSAQSLPALTPEQQHLVCACFQSARGKLIMQALSYVIAEFIKKRCGDLKPATKRNYSAKQSLRQHREAKLQPQVGQNSQQENSTR